MRARAVTMSLLFIAVGLAGCIQTDAALTGASIPPAGPLPAYEVRAPDVSLGLIESSSLIAIPGWDDVAIHVRLVRPDVDGPVPVIAQYTPYTAPGRAMLIEPAVGEPADTFVREFVRRGFAFAYADVRGTGDSGGCLDLRGSLDIQDAWHLTEWLGTQEWSNGKVGFIGASYPGSTSHIAAISNNPHLGGVIPVVASTSFYHYHHKGGVPYSNHLTTNNAYTAFAAAPTLNPQQDNWVAKQTAWLDCDTTHLTVQLDQRGTYDAWWADRDLRWRVGDVQVPVLMAQGLQDWNVKPDHIAHYFNDLDVRKVLVAGQWGHQYPRDAETDNGYGVWWEFATAFFDETLSGVHTGLFDEDRAFVQDTDGEWHVYGASWPPREAPQLALHLTQGGLSMASRGEGEVGWNAQPTSGHLFTVPADEQVVLELPPLERTLHASGSPRLDLTIVSTAENVHLVARLEMQKGDSWSRMNYGYLNPVYREGLDRPLRLVPHEPTPLTIDFHPQEDVYPAGAKLRLVLRSVDGGGTVPAFDPAHMRVVLDGERPATLWLPLSPLTHS